MIGVMTYNKDDTSYNHADTLTGKQSTVLPQKTPGGLGGDLPAIGASSTMPSIVVQDNMLPVAGVAGV